jgi:hypothetical protein
MCLSVVQFIKDENNEIHANSNSSEGMVENLFQQLQNTHAAVKLEHEIHITKLANMNPALLKLKLPFIGVIYKCHS